MVLGHLGTDPVPVTDSDLYDFIMVAAAAAQLKRNSKGDST
jgi:hypothetical protein